MLKKYRFNLLRVYLKVPINQYIVRTSWTLSLQYSHYSFVSRTNNGWKKLMNKTLLIFNRPHIIGILPFERLKFNKELPIINYPSLLLQTVSKQQCIYRVSQSAKQKYTLEEVISNRNKHILFLLRVQSCCSVCDFSKTIAS